MSHDDKKDTKLGNPFRVLPVWSSGSSARTCEGLQDKKVGVPTRYPGRLVSLDTMPPHLSDEPGKRR